MYDVDGRWLQREPAFLHEHEPEHHLEELALMAVSAEWLTRWQPISMHRALLAGATPDQMADAVGASVRGMYEQWKQLADGQRHSLIAVSPGVTQEVYETIQARLVAAGLPVQQGTTRLAAWSSRDSDELCQTCGVRLSVMEVENFRAFHHAALRLPDDGPVLIARADNAASHPCCRDLMWSLECRVMLLP